MNILIFFVKSCILRVQVNSITTPNNVLLKLNDSTTTPNNIAQGSK